MVAHEQGLSKAEIITLLTRTPHSGSHQKGQPPDPRSNAERLRDHYLPVGVRACEEDPEFFAHLIAWNHHKGEVRDAKAALPMIQLVAQTQQGRRAPVLRFRFLDENALAHLADLNPKLLVRALDLGKLIGAPKNLVHRFVTRYLRDLEADRRDFDATALQHRASVTTLYGRYHVAPSPHARAAFGWKDPVTGQREARVGKFEVVNQLRVLPAVEIAGAIDRYKLPWLIVRGALGPRIKEPDVLMAIIGRMTAADLTTSAKWLIRAGVKDSPQTRAAFEAALEKAGRPKRARGTVLKAGKKAKELAAEGEEKIAGKLQALQERQLEQLRTVKGDWAVLVDKSASMSTAIDVGRRVAEILGRLVQGAVHLIFFDTTPRYAGNVSGKSLAAIEMTTAAITANGGTSPGAAMRWLHDQKIGVDGIAIISDGGERHAPAFEDEYPRYCRVLNRDPTVYLYEVAGQDPNWLGPRCALHKIDVQHFNLRAGVDDSALPTLVQTMRVGRYSLLDEILGMKLRTLDEVLVRTVGMEVLGGHAAEGARQ